MLPYRLPRRFRRPLLLPPGWVALGFLLLLGCLVLRTHWRQLRPVNVVQITMPPLKLDTAMITFYREHRIKQGIAEYNIYTEAGAKNALVKINRMRPWHTVNFGGQPLADFFNAQVIESTIYAINADLSHAGGVRIRFRAGTTYANLVKVLDIMNYTNQKRYWFDNRQQPTTFYAITNKELPRRLRQPLLECACCNGVIKVPPSPPLWQHFWATYRPLAWRLPWLLLLALEALIIYKRSRTGWRVRQLK
jgi:hypothetical protein